MRFHVLTNFKTYTNKEYSACAFTQHMIRWAKLFTEKGHSVYIYGNGQHTPEVICSQYFEINTIEDLKEFENIVYSCNSGQALCFVPDKEDPIHIMDIKLMSKYIDKVSPLILNNIQENDLIIHSYGVGCRLIIDVLNNYKVHHVDLNVLTDYYLPEHAIFSTRWLHKNRTTQPNMIQPISYEIIQPMFDPNDFEPNTEKKDFFLYLARMQKLKGAETMFEIAKFFPRYKFVLAGFLPETNNTDEYWKLIDSDILYKKSDYPNVKVLGFANPIMRKKLLSECVALIQPSPYEEPFGFNVIEAYLSKTPVITTIKGAFSETVIECKTGFRCYSWIDYQYAFENVDKLDKEFIYKEGLKYTSKEVYSKYIKYFEQITI